MPGETVSSTPMVGRPTASGRIGRATEGALGQGLAASGDGAAGTLRVRHPGAVGLLERREAPARQAAPASVATRPSSLRLPSSQGLPSGTLLR
jgi:hypothetical protein